MHAKTFTRAELHLLADYYMTRRDSPRVLIHQATKELPDGTFRISRVALDYSSGVPRVRRTTARSKTHPGPDIHMDVRRLPSTATISLGAALAIGAGLFLAHRTL